MYSVPRRKRLASSDWTRFFRWFPPPLGSSGRMFSVYFVARTKRSRCPFRNSPVNFSLVPLVYRFAVSTKFPPASAKASKIFRLSSFEDPQPHSSPKVIVPRHSSETRNPVLPSSLYRMASASFRTDRWMPDSFLRCRNGPPESGRQNFRPAGIIVWSGDSRWCPREGGDHGVRNEEGRRHRRAAIRHRRGGREAAPQYRDEEIELRGPVPAVRPFRVGRSPGLPCRVSDAPPPGDRDGHVHAGRAG